MSLSKVKPGNMYQGWITHTWSMLEGCPHQCSYCYQRKWWERYRGCGMPSDAWIKGPLPPLGKGKTIFVCHTSDLFAEKNKDAETILPVLRHCAIYPENTYVFQTKNPARLAYFAERLRSFPVVVGTTIETDDSHLLKNICAAPPPGERAYWLRDLDCRRFVTIEPIMSFDMDEMLRLLSVADPAFVNIGADSKGHRLPEPSSGDVIRLYAALVAWGYEVRLKDNLRRIVDNDWYESVKAVETD